jgi:tetratricopeptide (TPR) repeat protein
VAPGTDSKAELLAQAAARRDAGELAEAERLLLAAADLDPGDPEPLHHLAHVHDLAGRPDLAEACYRRVLELAPGAEATRRAFGVLLLAQGRYPEGFALLETRHRLPAYPKPDLPFPEWTGGPVAGRRILIWPEQGLGDQIQFARFALVLKAMGAEVTLICWPPLVRLFAGSLGVRVLGAAGEVAFPDPDGWVMTCSVAGRLGLTPETLPNAPYLKAVTAWDRPLPAGFKVGLMAAGNPIYANDANRSLPEPAVEALRRLPAQIVDLRPAETGAADFADTAALIERLDLVVTVDTAVAHLAGAMGKPCWVLLPAKGLDWRWMRERRDSPWYPSVRLYRQATPGDWAPVLAEIAADLRALRGPRPERPAG